MAKLNRDETTEEEMDSLSIGSLSEATTLSDTQATCPTSSSSLGLSTKHESEKEEDKRVMKRVSKLTNRPEREGTSHTIEEVKSEAIREMHEIERKRKGKSVETQEVGESHQCFLGVAIRESQRNPILDIYDLTETDDEEATAPDDWRSRMVETMDKLVVANEAQNALLESQREQMTKVVDLVDRMISWMERESQPSYQLSALGRTQPQQARPNDAPGAESTKAVMKRKTAPDQPTTKDSALKRVRLELSREPAR